LKEAEKEEEVLEKALQHFLKGGLSLMTPEEKQALQNLGKDDEFQADVVWEPESLSISASFLLWSNTEEKGASTAFAVRGVILTVTNLRQKLDGPVSKTKELREK
jgi:hypothetical protein